MRRNPWTSLRHDVHVGPDVTGPVMERLGFRPVPRRAARLRTFVHVGTCLAVIGASIVGVAWVVDLRWRSQIGVDPSSRWVSLPPEEESRSAPRWQALEESLRPIGRFVDEIEPPAPPPDAARDEPPMWLSARAPLGET